VFVIVAFTVIVSAALYAIHRYERILSDGRVVLLRLAPVDPRSLMQGDYMALRFAVDAELRQALSMHGPSRSRTKYVYLRLDDRNRASFAGIGDEPLRETQQMTALRIRGGANPTVGPNAFFFEEGSAEQYANAQWGEFRVTDDGTALLTCLRDADLSRLGTNMR